MLKAMHKAMLKAMLKGMLKAMLRANCQLPTGSNGNWGVIHKEPSFRGLPILISKRKPRASLGVIPKEPSFRGIWDAKPDASLSQNKLEPL